jgi:hypothetical protein
MTLLKQAQIIDSYGNAVEASIEEELKVTQVFRATGAVFNGTLDSNFFSNSLAAGGTAAVSGMECTIATTTTSGSSAAIISNTVSRYQGLGAHLFRAIIRLGDTGAVNNVRRWGAGVALPYADGPCFQLSGTTFSIGFVAGGVFTGVASGSFNGTGSGTGGTWTVDTNYHAFEIYYNQIEAKFSIDGECIHVITAGASLSVSTRHFKTIISNVNTGVGSAVNIYCAGMVIARLGSIVSQPKSFWQSGTTAGVLLKTGPGSVMKMACMASNNNAVVTIYDGTSTGGTILFQSAPLTTAMGNVQIDFASIGGGMQFQTGLFLTVTAQNANVLTIYE